MTGDTRKRNKMALVKTALSGPAVLTVLALGLAGCADTPGLAETTDDPEVSFTGPYAAQFEYGMRAATSDFARAALSDGVISEQEFTESWGAYTDCLEDADITITVNFDGSTETSSHSPLSADEDQEVINKCSLASDEALVAALFFDIRRNPQGLDEDTIIAECLAQANVVPRGFAGTDLQQDRPADAIPFTDPIAGPEALARCRVDPLGLERG